MVIITHRHIGYRVACVCLAIFLSCAASNVLATNMTRAQMQTILDESLKALLSPYMSWEEITGGWGPP